MGLGELFPPQGAWESCVREVAGLWAQLATSQAARTPGLSGESWALITFYFFLSL